MSLPGPGEGIVILLIALLFVGGRTLPELGEARGKTIRSLRQGLADGNADRSGGGDPDGEAPADDTQP